MKNSPRISLQQALQRCVVIDIETTGLEPQANRIIEIGALLVIEGTVVDRFHSLINPNQPLPTVIRDLTGLSDALLSGAPQFRSVSSELLDFLTEGCPYGPPALVGHNVAFDFSFLHNEFLRITLNGGEDATDGSDNADSDASSPTPPYLPRLVCTAERSRELIPRERVGRYRLGKVAEYLDIPARPTHRADRDAMVTLEVAQRLARYE